MKKNSLFKKDLAGEQQLYPYLDELYTDLGFDCRRVSEPGMQYRGIDIERRYNGMSINIDEKSMIHYKNQNLPTFAFEHSYLNRRNTRKQGWLFDRSKHTDLYYLVTGIMTNEDDSIKAFKLTSVKRKLMVEYLQDINLDYYTTLDMFSNKELFQSVRGFEQYTISKNLSLTKTTRLAERPYNYKFRLEFLINNSIAKELGTYPFQKKQPKPYPTRS